MRAKLRHSYEALQNTVPGYVWPRAPPNKEGKLGPKLRDTGKLPLHLPMPKFLADPTHRTKVVAKKFFSLLKLSKQESEISKADCLRLKKYWGYMLKQNRSASVSVMAKAAKAPIEHLFDSHEFCGAWCKQKSHSQEQKQQSQQYYRSKVKNAKLYTQLNEAIADFTTTERLSESAHPFNTQTNEAMNTAVAKYAPKHKTYATTTSLQNRVNIAVGVQVWGYEKFWVSVFDELKIDVSKQVLKHFRNQDKTRSKLQLQKKDPKNKLKRAKSKIESIQDECLKTKKDTKEGRGYGKNKGTNISGDMVSLCACPGCPGKKNHKTAKSKECIWNNKFIGIKAPEVPSTITKIASDYSPVSSTIDAVDVLADILSHQALTADDAAAALQVKMNEIIANKTAEQSKIQYAANKNESDVTSKNLPGSEMNSSKITDTSTSHMVLEDLHTEENKTDFIASTDNQRTFVDSKNSNFVGENYDEMELLDMIEL